MPFLLCDAPALSLQVNQPSEVEHLHPSSVLENCPLQLLDFAQYLWICIHGTSDVFKLTNDLSDTLFPVTINDLQQPRAIVFLVSATSPLPLHDDVLICHAG